MSKGTEFLVLCNGEKCDVRFVEKANNLRVDDFMYQGYKIIGHGRCKDVDELNRGICSNMRAMYEYEHRQNTELKIQLEKALKILKDINRLSGSDEGRSVREQHKLYGGNIVKKLGLECGVIHAPIFPFTNATRFGCDISEAFKKFWEETN